MFMKAIATLTLTMCLLTGLSTSAALAETAQAPAGAHVSVEQVVVHSPALEGNLEGETPDRQVIVYLPPDYRQNPDKRYPVIYILHGYNMTAPGFAGLLQAQSGLDGAYAQGLPGVIVVLPDTQTLHGGSMYSNSVTIGDWEGFITHDLVAYIDSHYRTLTNRDSRGLAGHSMGGYGSTRLGMKYPDVYGALYIMSPCCLSVRGAPPPQTAAAVEAVQSRDGLAALDFLGHATFAVAAAWSPDPLKPPFYADLPTQKGQVDQTVLDRWAANAPMAMLDQYMFNLKRYKAIAIDVGDRDDFRFDAQILHQRMQDSGVANRFDIYPGDHASGVADRFQHNLLPFFAQALTFTK